MGEKAIAAWTECRPASTLSMIGSPRNSAPTRDEAMTAARGAHKIDNAADIMRVDLAYERLNHLWAMHGPLTIGAIYQYPGPRANVIGLDDSEVDRIVRGIRTFF